MRIVFKTFLFAREVRNDRNDSHCGNSMYCSQLNVAEPGGTNEDMVSQAEALVTKLQDQDSTEGDISFENDWKVITMFIGGNDLCRICEDFVSISSGHYEMRSISLFPFLLRTLHESSGTKSVGDTYIKC